jgi:hypothetical protein
MSAKIDTFLGEATVTDYVWQADNPDLQHILDLTLDDDGPAGYDPNPDHTAAMIAIKAIPGAALIRYDETEYDPSVIY